MVAWLIFAGILGYLLGSVNSSLIVGRFYGVDVRKHGSGNAGTTNTLRTLGKKAALFVLIGDLLKGILAYTAGFYIPVILHQLSGSGVEGGKAIAGMVAGTAAIIGHVWPVYFGFKGGKGVLTSLAVLLMIDWKVALILLGLFIIIVLLTRYVSLGSTVCAALFPVLSIILGRDAAVIGFSAVIAILIIYLHRTNIGRLLNGTESKLGAPKKQEVL